MKILILGITGKTGCLVAEEAIKRGHHVRGIARDKSRVNLNEAEIVAGTPYNYETVQKAINGCDCVISTLNVFPQSQGLLGKVKTPLDFMSASIKNTVMLMEEKGIKRLVIMTALGVGTSVTEFPAFFNFLVRLTNIRYAFADHDVQEKILEKSSLDWTVVRPVALNDKNDNLSILHYLDGVGRITSQISRKAVAHFMLDCVENGLFIRQKPGISNS